MCEPKVLELKEYENEDYSCLNVSVKAQAFSLNLFFSWRSELSVNEEVTWKERQKRQLKHNASDISDIGFWVSFLSNGFKRSRGVRCCVVLNVFEERQWKICTDTYLLYLLMWRENRVTAGYSVKINEGDLVKINITYLLSLCKIELFSHCIYMDYSFVV